MQMELLLSIIGVFGLLALSVNAYFFRTISNDLSTVKIDLATMIENSNNKERRLEKLEDNQEEIYKRLNELDRR